jgi:hypothetical protein
MSSGLQNEIVMDEKVHWIDARLKIVPACVFRRTRLISSY